MFLVASTLYDNTINNWFVYISRSYPIASAGFPLDEKWSIFWVYALIGMIFSPIGEELFYRGLVHESFALQWGDRKASVVDSAAFALTHLAHFGIVYLSGTWEVLVLPGLLWIGLLFGTCIIFFFCRQKTGSILGAILSHAGYNFAMTYFIFFYVLSYQ
jgi:membrane protease YdiL (CAAX protease family)